MVEIVVATMSTQISALNVNVWIPMINLSLLLLLLNLHKMIVKISGGHPGVKGRRIKGNVTELLLLKGAKKLVSTAKNYLLKLQLNLHVKTNGAHLNVKTRKIPGLNPVIGTGG